MAEIPFLNKIDILIGREREGSLILLKNLEKNIIQLEEYLKYALEYDKNINFDETRLLAKAEDYNAIAVELDSEQDRVNVNFESFFYNEVALYFKQLSDYIGAGKEQSARIAPIRDAVFKKIKGLPCQEVPKVLEQARQEIFNILERIK